MQKINKDFTAKLKFHLRAAEYLKVVSGLAHFSFDCITRRLIKLLNLFFRFEMK